MTLTWKSFLGAALLGAAASAAAEVDARADDVRPAPRDIVTVEESVPNTPIIVSGAVLLGASYVTSVTVAATSQVDSDQNLYAPLAGPWLDLAGRNACGTPSGPDCDHETTHKVLLVVDGVTQGLGALQILGGFVFPAKRTVTTISQPSLRVTPTAGLHDVGITAYGAF